jgi:hypothetical protein
MQRRILALSKPRCVHIHAARRRDRVLVAATCRLSVDCELRKQAFYSSRSIPRALYTHGLSNAAAGRFGHLGSEVGSGSVLSPLLATMCKGTGRLLDGNLCLGFLYLRHTQTSAQTAVTCSSVETSNSPHRDFHHIAAIGSPPFSPSQPTCEQHQVV